MDTNSIRQIVNDRAAELGISPWGIAKESLGRVSYVLIKKFMAGTSDMTCEKLQHVLQVLGIRFSPDSVADMAAIGSLPKSAKPPGVADSDTQPNGDTDEQ